MTLKDEQATHINIVNWFNYQYPDFKDDLHHFANERRCSVQEGRTLKRMGVKRGVADFFIALPSNGAAGFWIELKVGKNNPTKEQIEFLDRKLARGYHAAVVWGFDEAKDVISNYMKEYKSKSAYNTLKLVSNNKPIC